jgi:hypothetical protein
LKTNYSNSVTKRRLTVIDHADQSMGIATLLPNKCGVLTGHQSADLAAGGLTALSTAAVGTQRLTRTWLVVLTFVIKSAYACK